MEPIIIQTLYDFVSGWNGWTCEDEIDQCNSRPCKNGGVCINKQTTYHCACLFGTIMYNVITYVGII